MAAGILPRFPLRVKNPHLTLVFQSLSVLGVFASNSHSKPHFRNPQPIFPARAPKSVSKGLKKSHATTNIAISRSDDLHTEKGYMDVKVYKALTPQHFV